MLKVKTVSSRGKVLGLVLASFFKVIVDIMMTAPQAMKRILVNAYVKVIRLSTAISLYSKQRFYRYSRWDDEGECRRPAPKDFKRQAKDRRKREKKG